MRRRTYVSCREYVGIPKRARDIRIIAEDFVKQGGTAGEYSDPSLTDMEILSWTGFLCTRKLLRNVPVTPKKALRGCGTCTVQEINREVFYVSNI